MKQEEDHGDDQTSYRAPVMIKINSSLQHLHTDLMQHWFVITYMRQITDVCDPPMSWSHTIIGATLVAGWDNFSYLNLFTHFYFPKPL